MILRSNSWEDIISKKQDRAIKKLAKFFAIPKVSYFYYFSIFMFLIFILSSYSILSQDSISVGDVHGREIYEMTKYAIHKGIDKLDGHKKLGKIEFMVQIFIAYIPYT